MSLIRFSWPPSRPSLTSVQDNTGSLWVSTSPSVLRLSFPFPDGILWSTDFLILKKSNLSMFSLVAFALGVISKKPLPISMSWDLCPCFLVRVLLFWLTFKSLIHFELIFVMVWGRDRNSFFTCVPTPFVEKTILSHIEMSRYPC